MATEWEPDEETAALYARFKRSRTAYEQALKQIKDTAPDQLRKGATAGRLAKLTGLTDEVFRRIARDNGIERLREPTVGKDAKPKATEESS
jgi:hypothetical protein